MPNLVKSIHLTDADKATLEGILLFTIACPFLAALFRELHQLSALGLFQPQKSWDFCGIVVFIWSCPGPSIGVELV